jgi:hypothetical protein
MMKVSQFRVLSFAIYDPTAVANATVEPLLHLNSSVLKSKGMNHYGGSNGGSILATCQWLGSTYGSSYKGEEHILQGGEQQVFPPVTLTVVDGNGNLATLGPGCKVSVSIAFY